MSTEIIVETLNSTYTLRTAPEVHRAPTTVRHSQGAFVPPEALMHRGFAFNVAGFAFAEHACGGIQLTTFGPNGFTTSLVQQVSVNGVVIPVPCPLVSA